MNKKDINPVKLINYYKLINHNLIYNNKAINRYKKDNFELSGDKAENLDKLKKSILSLNNCDLKRQAKNIVFSDGNPNSKIMLIGEAPGAEEDKQGKPFVGEAGKLLDKMLSFIDLKREKNFYVTNILYWRPPGNRTPNNQEISQCLESTIEHIKIIKPKLIILVGGIAAKTLLKSQEGITKIRETSHYYYSDNDKTKIYTKAIFHPAYLLKNPIEKKRMWDDLLEIDKIISKNNIRR